jgi:tRNA dimethylallyltransferase
MDGEIDKVELYEQGAAATRQLAKRQLTWLRAWRDAREFDCMSPDLENAVLRTIGSALE